MAKVARAILPLVGQVVGTLIGGKLGGAIGTLVGSAAAALLFPPSKGKPRAASSASLSIGEVPRQAIVGRASTSGSLVDAFNYGGKEGTDWEVLVIALADHRCDALEGYYVNDAYVAFAGDGLVAGYNNQLEVHWRPGTETQTVPAILTANGPGWTANDNGAGVSYVVVAYKADAADAKEPIWTNGRPKFQFIVRGARCYDPRKDSSAGGVGAHRWLNPATWEWSENPIVARYAFARGFHACDRVTQPDQVLVGRGLSAVEAPPENLFARANLCDEIVDGEPRYRVGGVIEASESFGEVENDFAAACAGTISQPEGAVEIDPGEARAAVVTITDQDLVPGSKVRRSWFLGDADRGWINTVVAGYIEPAHKWQPHTAPVRRDVADVIADRAPREETLTLGFVTWIKQAGRIAEIVRRLGRLQIRADLVLPPRFCELEEGDWIIWQSDRYLGGAAYTFRVDSWGSDKAWHHSVRLRQISASCYSDTAPLTSGSVAVSQPALPPIAAPAAASWSATGQMIAVAGVQSPTLVVTGAQDHNFARFVRIRYAQREAIPPVNFADWVDAGLHGPDVTRREISVPAGGIFWAAVSYVVDGVEGASRVLGPVTINSMAYSDGTSIEAARVDLQADLTAAFGLARSRGKLTIGGPLPAPENSNTGDTHVGDDGVFYERTGGSLVVDGFAIVVGGVGGGAVGGYRPVVYWTPSAVQPLAATIAAADEAYTLADAAIDGVAGLADDGVLSANEKITKLLPEVARLDAKWTVLIAQAATLGVSTVAAAAKRTAWTAMLGALVPAWNDTSQASAVDRAAYDLAREDYDAELYALDQAIKAAVKSLADAAATTAVWNGVTGAGKPEDGATVGATPVQNAKIDSAFATAVEAQTTADAKITTYLGEMPPVGEVLGDLWFAEGVGELRRWTGSGWSAPLVDLTAAAVPYIEPSSRMINVAADHLGVVDPASFPIAIPVRRFRGDVDVSMSSVWSIVSIAPAGAATATVANGNASITALTQSCTFKVRSVRDGVTLDCLIGVTKQNAAPPSTGAPGGATSVSDSSLGNVGTSNVFAAISDVMTVKAGSQGKITLSYSLEITPPSAPPSGTTVIEFQWRWRPSGGSWTNLATVFSSPHPEVNDEEFSPGDFFYDAIPGGASSSQIVSALTAAADYEVQLFARRSSGVSRNHTLSGNASASGS